MNNSNFTKSIKKILMQFEACPESINWANNKLSLDDLWNDCPDPEWLLLCLKGLEYCDSENFRLFAISCAQRNNALFPDDRCTKILKLADAVANKKVDQTALKDAFNQALAISKDTDRNLEWNTHRSSALDCVRDTVRQKPWDAARRAVTNGQLASKKRKRELFWQVKELRRILEPDYPILKKKVNELIQEIEENKKVNLFDPSPNGAYSQHFDIASHCALFLNDSLSLNESVSKVNSYWERLEINLDALKIGGQSAIETGFVLMEDDPELSSIVSYLLAESEDSQPSNTEQAIALLGNDSAEIRNGARFGLQLASCQQTELYLKDLVENPQKDFASIAALDILAFHREFVLADIGEMLEDDEDEELSEEKACILAEAGGRIPDAWNLSLLEKFFKHSSPQVRKAALNASARSGLSDLPDFCRKAIHQSGSLEAVEFLGVIGSWDEHVYLQDLSGDPSLAKSALISMGRLGVTACITTIIEMMNLLEFAESAANAFWRITGCEPIRSDPPEEPPEGLSEDELDFWEPMGGINVSATKEWWQKQKSDFHTEKRYQLGMLVSDEPLGKVFDKLPMYIRHDLYLRERALTSNAPDWELIRCFAKLQ